MIEIRELKQAQMHPGLLESFRHIQRITDKYVKKGNAYELVRTDEIRQWNAEKRIRLSQYLCRQADSGGAVVGAFASEGRLVGFASLDGTLQGAADGPKYANLTMLFVDDEWKRQSIGRKLFERICLCARDRKADRLFISAISSYETIAFYFSMGCTDAKSIIESFVDTEEDRYLEYALKEDMR